MIHLEKDLKKIPNPGHLGSKFPSPQLKLFQAHKSVSDDDESEEESKEKNQKKNSKSFIYFSLT